MKYLLSVNDKRELTDAYYNKVPFLLQGDIIFMQCFFLFFFFFFLFYSNQTNLNCSGWNKIFPSGSFCTKKQRTYLFSCLLLF